MYRWSLKNNEPREHWNRFQINKSKKKKINFRYWPNPQVKLGFGDFGSTKSRFLDFLKVVLEMFRSCLGVIFGLKMPTFSCIFSSKGRYMTSKIKFWVKIWPSERVILTILGSKKVIFWTFWKLFWSCSEVVWELFLASKAQFSVYF